MSPIFGRIAALLLVWSLVPAPAQAGSLTLVKSVDSSTSLTGASITFTINYTCPGITGDCTGVVIKDVLPTGLNYVGIVGDGTNTTSSVYTTSNRTATWTMKTPLTAGTTGSVKLIAAFPARVTPDGTQVVNQATATGSNITAVTSNTVTVTASATTNFVLTKTRSTATSTVNQDVVYRLRIDSAMANGLLNLTGAVMTDTVPTGAFFVSATNGGTLSGAAGNGTGGTVTWNLGTVTAATSSGSNSLDRYLTLRYPTPTFSTSSPTNSVTNNSAVSGTPVGASTPITPLTASVTHTLTTETKLNITNYFKYSSATSNQAPRGGSIRYRHEFQNSGPYPYDSLTIVDTLPAQLRVTSIRAGQQQSYSTPFGGSIPLVIDYQTNLNTAWRSVTGSPFATNVLMDVAVSTLGLATGEDITALRYTYSSVPVGFVMTASTLASGYLATLLAVDRNGVAVSVGQQVINSAVYTAKRTGFTDLVGLTRTATVTVIEDGPQPQLYKAVITGGNANPGDPVQFEIRVVNQSTATSALAHPMFADLLEAGLEYDSSRGWTVQTKPTGMTAPTFLTPDTNYDSTGRTLLRWRWDGTTDPATYSVPVGPTNNTLTIRFYAKVKSGTVPGAIANRGILASHASTTLQTGNCTGTSGTFVADTYDVNGNGNRTELLCNSPAVGVTVLEAPSLGAAKLVKGQLDTSFTAYPSSGLTVAGGSMDFRFVVTNTGNVSMTKGVITDILPFVGDTGVVDTSARQSAWRPQLTAPIATPTGVVAYYSTAGNPCRPEMNPTQPSVPADFWPAGCLDANWSVLPPTDITTVQSIRLDFGSVVLSPAQSFTFTYPLQAPVGAPTNGVIAWNSFGYRGEVVGTGTKLLPSEPVKVGIAVQAPAPANYGNYVWRDDNGNGIQDEAASRGLNGVRVELYRYRGTGAAAPALDTLVGFRLTGADGSGNPGFYQFTNQPAGDYYALFFRPAGYAITGKGLGGNAAMDSDADPATGLTAITSLTNGEIDMTWDAGVYPSTTGEVGNYCWFDRNGNGIQNEATLDGLNGITVRLYLSGGTSPVATTVTADDVNHNPGYYGFSGLTAFQAYFLEFVKPTGATFSPQNQGSDDNLDSDVAVATGRTAEFTVGSGAFDPSWDAGIQLPTGTYSLGDRVWQVEDDNGVYEPLGGADVGLSGVRVNLYRDNGDGILDPVTDTYWSATTSFVSAGPGFYGFGSLPAGNWIIQLPEYQFATGAVLHGLIPRAGAVLDPRNNVDNDNNGFAGTSTDLGVVTGRIVLGSPSTYPANFNPTLDIGLITPTPRLSLTPATASSTVCTTSHTVTATVIAADSTAPVVGQLVTFTVTAGPNLGQSGTASTNSSGQATYTYTGSGGLGIDTVTASILVGTNRHVTATITKTWVLPAGGLAGLPRCDADSDGDVDKADFNLVYAARNSVPSSYCDQRDPDRNRRIEVTDAKICLLLCTRPNCVTQ